MRPDTVLGIVLSILGMGLMICMYKNYDFMFTSNQLGDRKFNAMVRIFGRDLVRAFYGLLGAFLAVLGALAISDKLKLVKPKEPVNAIQPVGQRFNSRITINA